MTRPNGLVVADDLTGAMDTGHEFAARGLSTLVLLGEGRGEGGSDDADDADVLVANTDSRYLPAEDAASAVDRALSSRDTSVVYKKVDSTLRGNLVAETDAAIRSANADAALVAPAFPRNGRTTACGYHLVDGWLVTDTAAGRDPDRPVETAHLPTRFGDSSHPVRRVGVERAAAGSEAVRDALREFAADGPAVVVADAVAERHLEALADGAATSGLSVVYVGSAGLARHVSVAAEGRKGRVSPPDPTADGPEGPALAVAGSTNPRTLEQVRALPDELLVELDLEATVADPDRAASDAAERCLDRLDAGGDAVLVSARTADDADVALRAGRARGVGEWDVRERVSTALAGAVERVWDRVQPRGLFATGGAVAISVLGALGATGVRLAGSEVEAGVPVGRIDGGRADGTPVVTKAGAFGSTEAISNCLAVLGGRDDPR
ncbi:four-carbon acid sugar kinase family protein [Halegenticoccus soli]|uniref:four-carbon acid sugar kinase family protein n=1 Tax=Halegenticoccus soli TaxID=1985678 RepID=UPI000C6E8EDE|nr:four-carbon acid sugar kinase family protein [Halegenticoccus soli]